MENVEDDNEEVVGSGGQSRCEGGRLEEQMWLRSGVRGRVEEQRGEGGRKEGGGGGERNQVARAQLA